jgi:hypothetical protein
MSDPAVSPDIDSKWEYQVARNKLLWPVLRAVLDGTQDLVIPTRSQTIRVRCTRMPSKPWPLSLVDGLDQATNGSWPAGVRAYCTWDTGSASLDLQVGTWHAKGEPVQIGLKVKTNGEELTWARNLFEVADHFILAGSAALATRGGEEKPAINRLADEMRQRMRDVGLPFHKPGSVELVCIRRGPNGGVLTTPPDEVLRRVILFALVKLAFQFRDGRPGAGGQPPFPIGSAAEDEGDEQGHNQIGALPGGVSQYKNTLDTILSWLPADRQVLLDLLRNTWSLTGERAPKSYLQLPVRLGLVEARAKTLSLTDQGRRYLERRDPLVLFEHLCFTYRGVLETLVLIDVLGPSGAAELFDRLPALVGIRWETTHQVNHRKNWLLSLGLVEPAGSNLVRLTELGREALRHAGPSVEQIRLEIDKLPDEGEPEENNESSMSSLGVEGPLPLSRW